MFGLGFLFPALMIATAAAAAPVIIHLLMRPRPRTVVFPAIRFVMRSHRANLKRLRLRQLLLVALRMAAIIALVMLLARPLLNRGVRTVDASEPAAAVFVLDNSGSMNAAQGGRPRLERAKSMAMEILEALPVGSRAAVLAGEEPSPTATLLGDRKLVAQQIADVPTGFGGRPLAAAMARARVLLAAADLPRRELYVLTDMTAAAWRERAGEPPGDGVSVTLLNCAGQQVDNVAIESLKVASDAAAVGAEVAIDALLLGGAVGGEVIVQAELDGKPVDRKAVRLTPGEAATVRLMVRPQRSGAVHGRVSLAGDDALAMDNVRYFTLQVDESAELLIVRDAAMVGRGDPTSFLMGAAAAPSGAEAGWVRRRTVTSDRLDAEALAGADVVLLADVAAPDETQWKLLEAFARRGGCVWIVPGPLSDPRAYNAPAARAVMPAALGVVQRLDEPMGWRAVDADHPMLSPFADRDNPPLSEVLLTRRLEMPSLPADASEILGYDDGTAAMIERAVGDGRAVLWNFSPDPEFSNLATLEQFPILVQRMLRVATAGWTPKLAVTWGDQAVVPVPRDMPTAVATIRRPGLSSEQVVAPESRTAVISLPADRLGGWSVRFTEGDRQVERGFAVNAAAGESDLDPMEAAQSGPLLRELNAMLANNAAGVARRRQEAARPLDLAGPFLLALLAIVIAESLLANRFYKPAGEMLTD